MPGCRSPATSHILRIERARLRHILRIQIARAILRIVRIDIIAGPTAHHRWQGWCRQRGGKHGARAPTRGDATPSAPAVSTLVLMSIGSTMDGLGHIECIGRLANSRWRGNGDGTGRRCGQNKQSQHYTARRGQQKRTHLCLRGTAGVLRLAARRLGDRSEMVLPVRIELTTSPLPRGCSTTELRQRSTENRSVFFHASTQFPSGSRHATPSGLPQGCN